MTEDRRGDKPAVHDNDILDEPLVRYSGTDAILPLGDGDAVDLNATPDPFTGVMPAAAVLTALQMHGDDGETDARQRIGRRLRALREDLGLSRKDLAPRAGIGQARLADVEGGNAELGMSFVASLVQAMGAQLSDIAAADAPEVSMRHLTRIGESAGVPKAVLERIGEVVGRRRFPAALERGFGWKREPLFAGAPRSPKVGALVAFNARQDARPPDDSPVLALARRMSELSASEHESSFDSIPDDPAELRRQVLAVGQRRPGAHAGVTLDMLLSWTWDSGIIVLPLTKAKDFGAGVWFVDEDPVVMLQENRPFGAYWLYDLAHELGHLALGHVVERGIVDVGEQKHRATTAQHEQEAINFGLELLLPGAEEMIADVRRRTANDAPHRFKFAVAAVARESNVSAGVLGFAAARAMWDVPEDKDRWGSASNLAREEDDDGRARVEAAFSERIRPVGLDELDAALLRAVSSST